VCKKPGCWSTKHTEEERTKAYRKFKDQLVTELRMPKENLHQFLLDYKGISDEGEIDIDS
jgi:hypothetical protein